VLNIDRDLAVSLLLRLLADVEPRLTMMRGRCARSTSPTSSATSAYELESNLDLVLRVYDRATSPEFRERCLEIVDRLTRVRDGLDGRGRPAVR
jgi:hypothetical protein